MRQRTSRGVHPHKRQPVCAAMSETKLAQSYEPSVDETDTVEVRSSESKNNTLPEYTHSVVIVIFVASLIILVQSWILCDRVSCKDELGYALAAGVISSTAALVYLLMLRFAPSCGVGIMGTIWAALFFCFWSVSAGVFTFDQPYYYTGNGYFASWIAWFSSVFLLYISSPWVQKHINGISEREIAYKLILVLFLASVVELASSIHVCDQGIRLLRQGFSHQK